MREFASTGALRTIVSAGAVLGCLGLVTAAGSIAGGAVAGGATATVVLADNTPWGVTDNTPWGITDNTPWGAVDNTPRGLTASNTPWG